MFFRQYELPCLSLFSYMIGDETTGRAVVVDPQRDVSGYLADAADRGLTIELVIETHFHADFLSGHLELAAATGAAIAYGSDARADFAIQRLDDRQVISLGEVAIEVRHTPGHTPESISLVVRERADDPTPFAVLTGDTLFVGDVGRPDLLASVGTSADTLARSLFRSLHDQLLVLPDETLVYPAHGAGSACGKAMTDAVSSTIGEQRRTNYALQDMSEDDFVEVVTEGQSAAPLYFPFTADSNRRVRPLLDDAEPPVLLDLEQLEVRRAEGALVVDARSPEVFASGHLAGSVNVGLDGRFAEYAGDVVRPDREIVVVTEPGHEAEARVRLARIGFDRVVGAVVDIERILAEHPDLARRAPRFSSLDLQDWLIEVPDGQLVDIRGPGEQEGGILTGAVSLPLPELLDRTDELDPARPVVLYCGSGYRSSAGASLLRSVGFETVADLQGGYAGWVAAGLPVTTGEVVR